MSSHFKNLGILLGFLPIGIIIYGFVFSSPSLVLPFLLSAVAVNILLLVIAPRIWKNPALSKIKMGAMSVFSLLNNIIVSAVLAVAYVFSVGIVFIFSRIIGKKFMNLYPKKTSWVKIEKAKEDYLEM
ncbi:MAG: hypothetical protein V1776_03115 [Candidatus Diapherotrites archaeon]